MVLLWTLKALDDFRSNSSASDLVKRAKTQRGNLLGSVVGFGMFIQIHCTAVPTFQRVHGAHI